MNKLWPVPVIDYIAEWIRQKEKEDPDFIGCRWNTDKGAYQEPYWIDVFNQHNPIVIDGTRPNFTIQIKCHPLFFHRTYDIRQPDFFEWFETNIREVLSLARWPAEDYMISELRPYQESAIQEIMNEFNSGIKSVQLVLPTGAGKTITAINIAKKFTNVLWLAHRDILLHQAELVAKQHDVDIMVCSLFAAPSELDQNWDLIIIDEAHHSSMQTARKFIQSLNYKHLLGLTATPYRLDNAPLYFDVMINPTTDEELTNDGNLLPIKLFTLRYVDLVTNLTDWMKDRDLGKTIIFVPSVEKARKIQARLPNSAIFTGTTPKSVLDDFGSNDLSTLISCIRLTTGVDVPAVQTVVIARRTKSESMLRQMIGRARRPHLDQEACNIIQCISMLDNNGLLVSDMIEPIETHTIDAACY